MQSNTHLRIAQVWSDFNAGFLVPKGFNLYGIEFESFANKRKNHKDNKPRITICRAVLEYKGSHFKVFYGISERNPIDTWDPDKGRLCALKDVKKHIESFVRYYMKNVNNRNGSKVSVTV